MRKCRQCGAEGDIRDVQPFLVEWNGKPQHVWLHPGQCSHEWHQKLREHQKKSPPKQG